MSVIIFTFKYSYLSDLKELNPIRAEIFSHPIGAGGGSYMTPPLSPDIAVIEGQTKKQMIKLWKNTNFKKFLTFFTVI